MSLGLNRESDFLHIIERRAHGIQCSMHNERFSDFGFIESKGKHHEHDTDH